MVPLVEVLDSGDEDDGVKSEGTVDDEPADVFFKKEPV